MTSQPTTAMTSAKFSVFVLSIDDIYNMGIRNGFYLPKQSSSAVNELMLTNVLRKEVILVKLLMDVYNELYLKSNKDSLLP